MFIITWMFDKLGYMPKIDMEVGKVNIQTAWPFPASKEDKDFFGVDRPAKKKPTVKKATTRKPAAKKAK
jgi:hypothetical protein